MRRPSLLIILVPLTALAFAALACSLPTPNVVVVTATASPIPVTPTITPIPATATPTLPPTPSPAPTIAANVGMDKAATLVRNGDYASAVTIYQNILDQPVLSVDPNLRANAAINLGSAALREGQFADAVPVLSDFIETYPSDSRLAQAYFMRGDAYMGQSQWQNAINDYQVYLDKRPGIINSYAFERIGDAYLALKAPDKSLDNYSKAVGASRGDTPLTALREKAAAAYINAGDAKDAIAQYDAIVTIAKVPDYKAGIALSAANLVYGMGDKANAQTRYQEIMSDYPDTSSAYTALQTLLRIGAPVNDLLRGQISYSAQDYKDAIAALYNYTSNTTLDQVDPSVFMTLGSAYRAVGNTSAANTSFQIVIDQYPKSPQYGSAWLEQGRTLLLGGDTQGAIAKYKQLATDHPDVSQGAEALWRAGYLYSTIGDTEDSLSTFESLGNQFKGTDWAMDGLFRGGMAAYNGGSNSRAQRFFSLLATTGNGMLKAAGAFWLGRLYQLDNQPQLARESYTMATTADPGGYYSLRANDILAGHGPFVAPAKLDLSYNDAAHLAEADKWLRDKFKITQTGSLSQLSEVLKTDPRMIRGNELWSLDAFKDAQGEFDSLTADYTQNPLALYQLATHYSQIGLYHSAIDAITKMLSDNKVAVADAPKAIAALAYPVAYYDLVLPNTSKYSVDPLLVFSLIRQESLYESIAVSSAAAQGLMQIIPDTANYIAQKLSWPDYQPNDIYRPYINVAFGVYYLREQLDTFDGNVPASLAAYNAGPGAVTDWLRISNGDPDLFVQAIDIDQTKSYVQLIYEQYEAYAAIYGVK